MALAAGVGGIAAIGLLFGSLQPAHRAPLALLAAALAGLVSASTLRHNFNPAQALHGRWRSYFPRVCLAAISIVGPARASPPSACCSHC